MRNIIFFLLLLSFGLVFNSCKKDIDIPSYIHVKSLEFTVKNGQGSPLQNITHFGVYINDNLEGIFEAPVTFPVLQTGTNKVEIRPFIKRLAREGFVIYTMANGYFKTIELKAGQVDTISPTFQYESNTKFVWLEDFNANAKSIKIVSGTMDTILLTKSKGAGVDTSLYAYMSLGNVQNSFFEVETEDVFTLPLDGRDVFLEFHYKCNIPFSVGLVEISTNGDRFALPSVSPFDTKGQWAKGYIYLNDELVAAAAGTKYKVFFTALNGDANILPEIFIDNLKLMYRE